MSPDERWNGFLAKIRSRADEILKEASDGTADYIASPDFDQNALSQLWTAIRLRLIELGRKVDDTWSDTASALFESAGRLEDGYRALDRGRALRNEIEADHARAEARAWAAVGRWVEQRAAAHRVAETICARCGARHSVVGIRATHEWTCASCHAVATFQPGTFEYQMPAAADYIARDRAWDLREQPAQYWPVYLAAVAEVLPERAATLQADIAAKLASGDKPR